MPHVDGDDDGVGYGVFGSSPSGNGVRGSTGDAVFDPDANDVGVYGTSKSSPGVHGHSNSGDGVFGRSKTGIGVSGRSDDESSAQVYMAPLVAIPTPIVRIAPVCLATHFSKAQVYMAKASTAKVCLERATEVLVYMAKAATGKVLSAQVAQTPVSKVRVAKSVCVV